MDLLLGAAPLNRDTDSWGLRFHVEPSINALMLERKNKIDLATAAVCKWFARNGHCTKGNSCSFRHTKYDTAEVCKHWRRGLCTKMDNCEYLHEMDLSKMPECQFFRDDGRCNKPECPFVHNMNAENIPICAWYQNGFCRLGPQCRNRHVRREACPDYLAGFCIKGPECENGHPKTSKPVESFIITAPRETEEDIDMKDNNMPFQQDNRNRFNNGGNRQPFNPGQQRHIARGGYQMNSQKKCHNCGETGHFTGSCPLPPRDPTRVRPKRDLKTVTCFKCHGVGHYANVCPNLKKAAPPGGFLMPFQEGYAEQQRQLLAEQARLLGGQ